MVGAVGLLGYPKYTDIRASRQQKALRAEFLSASNAKLKQAYQAAAQPATSGTGGTRVTLAEGSAITRIQIPKLGVDTIVVEGTSNQALAAGTGHYPQTPLPCSSKGNTSYAGHRTMNGHPFQHLDQLVQGDKVIMTTPFQTCTYEILGPVDGHANPWVTDPNDWTVIAQTTQPMLTMSTCTPEGTARQRLVARAKLVSVTNLVAGSTLK